MSAAPLEHFGHILESVLQESDELSSHDDSWNGPLRGALAAIDLPASRRLEGLAVWDRAINWIDDLKAQNGEQIADATDPGAIALELQLHSKMQVGDLLAIRRAFMWHNHPDRAQGLSPELAGRRAAIANMLIDAMVIRAKAAID